MRASSPAMNVSHRRRHGPPRGSGRPAAAQASWEEVLRGFSIAFLLTGAPIALHLASQPVALIFCIVASILAARAFEQDVPIIVLVANIFQNVFISLVSVNYSTFSDIELLKSYNFVTTIVCYAVVVYGYLRQPGAFSPFVTRMMLASAGVLAIVGVYFILGLAINPRSAVIYLRNISLPLFMFQTFLIVGVRHSIPLPQTLFVLLGLIMACCYVELFANDAWLTLTNGFHYLDLFTEKRMLNVDEIRTAAGQGVVITSPLDYGRTNLFNTTLTADLGIQVQRLNGPNFNTISLAYLLSILIAFLAVNGFPLSAAIAMPLLLATSAKGPLILALGCIGFVAVAKRARSNAPILGLGAGLAAYALFVFLSGYRTGDYHVIGLLGGLNGFFKLPIGHTLGQGGNLSIEDFSKIDWGAFQRAGATDTAVESAFGVLLFQMGVCVVFVIGFYLWIARCSWRLFLLARSPALAFAAGGILICLVNGLYQEEAYFVPLSLPVVMGLVALTLGATDRVFPPSSARMTP
ncbi:hypothetical protein OGR47_10425 [Methylocystis sp. MJC1]|uniref:hypothetical protein n=1 Tax=Methylocystis sp. MJC1 TaxID=2654282 RepID=UPI0013E9B02B|nr:hypothetical protein [Methylocystis sp. MJC1]KAF2992260.1 hypothetical protein MJC1_00638 [Methylocystis sp. MJC1]MBU6527400.1 hypothetical protein [Methylocystis sp. MJC1]UZX10350.1 hypothetical protein OGR47_10425 [Methylocystis sp. MJC1]